MADFPQQPADLLTGGGCLSSAATLATYAHLAPASTAWRSADLAIFVPIRVASSVTVYKLTVGAGATAAGNFDVGIYDGNGNRLVSSGSTAKGSSTEHIIDITDTILNGPAIYYLAMAADGTNNYIGTTITSGGSPATVQKVRIMGVMEAAASFPLPSTVTFAANTGAWIPSIAAYLRRF